MKKFTFFVLCAALLSLAGCKGQDSNSPAVSNEKPVKIGFMICDSRKESQERFAPFVAYLSEKTGRKFEMTLANTFEFEKLFKEKKVDFFHVNSLVAILLKKKFNADFLAVDIRGRHGYKASGTIIARKDSGIKTFEDMRGKNMIFGPALAPFGYMAQYDLMLQNGIDPETDLSNYVIPPGAAKHDKVLYGVYFGKYALGAAPRIDLDRMIDAGIFTKDDFTVIAESEAMPYCTIGAQPDADPALKEQIKQLALNLTKDESVLVDGEVLKVLDRMLLDGFAPAVDSEYDPIRERLKRCNMAPYRKF